MLDVLPHCLISFCSALSPRQVARGQPWRRHIPGLVRPRWLQLNPPTVLCVFWGKDVELGPTRGREGSQRRLGSQLGPGDSKCPLSICYLHRSLWSELALPMASGHSSVTTERGAILPSWPLRCPTGLKGMGRWRSHHNAGSGGCRVVGAGLEARVPRLPAVTSSWRVAWWVLSTVPEASGTCRELLDG